MFKRSEFEAMQKKYKRAKYGGQNDFYASYSVRLEGLYIEEVINSLRNKLKDDIIVTDAWSDDMDEQEINKEDLLPYESWAVTFPVGCYTVRFAAKGLYFQYEGGASMAKFESGWWRPITFEISAKHNIDPEGAFADVFKDVCQHEGAVTDYIIPQIDCICTARDKDDTDERASLFVRAGYYWYKLSPDGAVTVIDEPPDFKQSGQEGDRNELSHNEAVPSD